MAVFELAPKQKVSEHIWLSDEDHFINADGNYVITKYYWDCESPRSDENLGTFYTWLNSYNSPDDAPDLEDLFTEYGLWDEWEKAEARNPIPWFAAKLNELGHVALPVAAYIHGGVAYSVGSPSQFPDSMWDAGYAGVIFVEAEKVCGNEWCSNIHEITPETRKLINRYLADEVDYYNEWAQGHTYYYREFDRNGDEIDSCGGFIGDDAMTNGIVDCTGMLIETSLDLDEWVEVVTAIDEVVEDVLEGMAAANENWAA